MKKLLPLLCGILLSACATVQYKPSFVASTPDQTTSWQIHKAKIIQQQDNWRFSGRFGASTEDEAWSGSIWWLQQQHDYQIELAGPMSQGTIRLVGDETHASLQLAEDSTYTDGDAESLLSRYTGLTLPFSGLRYWVLGLPQPLGQKQQVTLDDRGRISSIRQTDWNIQFQRYRQIGDLELPRKIVLQNDEIKVRLVMDQWGFNG